MRGSEFTRGVHEDLQIRPVDHEERHLTPFPIHHLVLVDRLTNRFAGVRERNSKRFFGYFQAVTERIGNESLPNKT